LSGVFPILFFFFFFFLAVIIYYIYYHCFIYKLIIFTYLIVDLLFLNGKKKTYLYCLWKIWPQKKRTPLSTFFKICLWTLWIWNCSIDKFKILTWMSNNAGVRSVESIKNFNDLLDMYPWADLKKVEGEG